MYGLSFTFTILLLILITINTPFILYYLYFWLGSLFSTEAQDEAFDEIKTAFSTLSKEETIALFPFKMFVFLGNFLLKFKSATVWIMAFIMGGGIIRSYFVELETMFKYLNWKIPDITMFTFGSFAILYLLYNFFTALRKTNN